MKTYRQMGTDRERETASETKVMCGGYYSYKRAILPMSHHRHPSFVRQVSATTTAKNMLQQIDLLAYDY